MPDHISAERPYFLIPSAFVVEGASRMLLLDTERKENFIIPSKFKKMLENRDELSLKEAKSYYGYDNDEFDSIVEFLTKNDLVYFSNMNFFYKPIQKTFDYPAIITNAIIDIGNEGKFTTLHSAYLMEINCFHIQIRYFRSIDIEELKELLSILRNMFVMSVELTLTYSELLKEQELADAISDQVFIEAVICYNSELEKRSNLIVYPGQILYYTKQTLSHKGCGIVSPSYFTSTIPAFTESTKHNSCLNRKISIDSDGNIKNCPSMKESFGNIKDTTLVEAIEKPGFKKYWNLKKDDIKKCKDCEFRYICTDCRAYIEDPEDIYSAPLKCGYDPYTGEWSEWSDNPLKKKAIKFYGMEDLIVKDKKN